ncbi:Ribosome biogenesis GTPase A [Zostera marina]|uniref:Ribosome biogenesis GTPase A n=1 Tax=Zostera marina TaxID=29655 RepID=A0A0K9P3M5_ZOSMR|nr:Ribosome biogenesis GTPase A [Zostera marina]
MGGIGSFSTRLGAIVRSPNISSSWFTTQMAAAVSAIVDRIPLVDFMVEVRDARVPLSSGFDPIRRTSGECRRIVILNKSDLADRAQTEKWVEHFEQSNCFCYAINSHNKDNIKKLLNCLCTRIRELGVNTSYTASFMIVGIPNVGKSSIVNAMHQIGRISAEEKGKLKHAIVNTHPGETKDITSFKIASHPNIYLLDTPGVLPLEMSDLELGSKLALIGAIDDCLVGEVELARCFLSILNRGEEYKCWEKLNSMGGENSHLGKPDSQNKRRRKYPTDHTQDFIVRDVRKRIYNSILEFEGNLENDEEMLNLIDAQLLLLHEAFRVSLENGEDGYRKVAVKLLNLYRIGRLGRYTLDNLCSG